MSFNLLGRLFLEWQVCAAVMALLLMPLGAHLRPWVRLRDQHRLSRWLMLMTLAIPALKELGPTRAPFEAPVQVWPASDLAPFSTKPQVSSNKARIEVRGWGQLETPLGQGELPFAYLLVVPLVGLALALRRILRDRWKLERLRARSYSLRRVGRVEVRAHDELDMPFSCWLGRRAFVFLPTDICGEAMAYKASVAHEIQHHRQRDPQWAYALEILRALSFLNPVLRIYFRKSEVLQELACDEALLERHRVSPGHYARCLFELAQRNLEQEDILVGTASMSSSSSAALKGRIEMTLKNVWRNESKTSWYLPRIAACALVLGVSVAAWASQGLIQDRRITKVQAEELVQVTNSRSKIPVTLNAEVLDRLNRAVGTEQGRRYMRNAFARMKSYQGMIESKLQAARLPRELLATPVYESGYRNLDNGVGAGIWAFIPYTARRFGLRVDDKNDRGVREVDERMDAAKLTDAAVGYYSHLYSQFGDWHLALVAYNVGEGTVEKAIQENGTRNAWELLESSNRFSNESRAYLPELMVAIILLENPQLLD